MDYIAPLIALTAGILGAFFNEKGERQTLTWVSSTLLCFAAVSVVVTALDIWNANVRRIETEAELAQEKITSASLRGLLLASQFAPSSEIATDGILILTPNANAPAQSAEDGEIANDSIPDIFPFTGNGIKNSRFEFEIFEIVSYNYTFSWEKINGQQLIESNWYNFGEKKCSLTRKSFDQEYKSLESGQCDVSKGFSYNAWVDHAPETSLIIKLPSDQAFWKVFSRFGQQEKMFDEPIGRAVVTFDNTATATRGQKYLEQLDFSIKFFDRTGLDDDNCYSSLLVKYTTDVSHDKLTTTVAFDSIADYEFNFCELSPI